MHHNSKVNLKRKKNKMAVAAYLSAKDKIKEAVLAELKNK